MQSEENKTPAPGVLYLVATPLGNLEDITARALRVLREVHLIAAEDTRVTRKLLAHFDIHTFLTAYHAHSTDKAEEALIARLVGGESIALVSDAGTPCISDPGTLLVQAAIAANIRVEPIPGANAALAALIASGLPTGRFIFEGFLPRTRSDRLERVQNLVHDPRTAVLYEAPTRLIETLTELRDAMGGERSVSVGRELTKKFEEFVRGTLDTVLVHFTRTAPRGECVIVLSGSSNPVSAEEESIDTESLLRAALGRGQSPRDAARDVARITGLPRNEVYGVVLRLGAEPDEATET